MFSRNSLFAMLFSKVKEVVSSNTHILLSYIMWMYLTLITSFNLKTWETTKFYDEKDSNVYSLIKFMQCIYL